MVDHKIDQVDIDSTHSVETALASLWEKAREASYLISTLRDEKKKLQMRVDELLEELSTLKNDLLAKQSQYEDLRREHNDSVNTNSVTMNLEEKRNLQNRISSLIVKLDQYLSS